MWFEREVRFPRHIRVGFQIFLFRILLSPLLTPSLTFWTTYKIFRMLGVMRSSDTQHIATPSFASKTIIRITRTQRHP